MSHTTTMIFGEGVLHEGIAYLEHLKGLIATSDEHLKTLLK